MSMPQPLQLVKFIARIVDEQTGQPLVGPAFKVRFYDLDLFKDDPLGQAELSKEGVAEVICHPGDYQAGALGVFLSRLKEKKPDIYLEVIGADGSPLYRSRVVWNVDPTKVSGVTGQVNPTVDLGTFMYRRGGGLDMPAMGAGMPRPMQ